MQSVSRDQREADNLESIEEYNRLVKSPEARRELEKQNPDLVAARDQAIVELRREKLQKETAEKPHRVARVRRQIRRFLHFRLFSFSSIARRASRLHNSSMR